MTRWQLTRKHSYEALESWFDAVQDANNRKGSAPLPTIIVGSKLDLAKDRAVEPKDVEFPRNKGLPYLEISSKANHKTKELLLGLVRALLGYVFHIRLQVDMPREFPSDCCCCRKGIQLTDEVELVEASAKVDEDSASAAIKEYSSVSK
jgi:GTPase SAR1 family protein